MQVGQFYVDPDSGEPREIDVIATFDFSDERAVVSFVVECKSSTRPWVMMTTPGRSQDLRLETRVFHSKWGPTIDGLRNWSPTRSCIDLTGRVAYTGTRVMFDKKDGGGADSVFPALLSATKAAYWLATSTAQSSPEILHIAFPVIVLDAPLFSCALADESDDIEVTAIDSAIPLRWARPVGGRQITVVDVVVANELAAYVSQSVEMARDIVDEMRRPQKR